MLGRLLDQCMAELRIVERYLLMSMDGKQMITIVLSLLKQEGAFQSGSWCHLLMESSSKVQFMACSSKHSSNVNISLHMLAAFAK